MQELLSRRGKLWILVHQKIIDFLILQYENGTNLIMSILVLYKLQMNFSYKYVIFTIYPTISQGLSPTYELIQIEGAVHEPSFRYRVSFGDKDGKLNLSLAKKSFKINLAQYL